MCVCVCVCVCVCLFDRYWAGDKTDTEELNKLNLSVICYSLSPLIPIL